MDDKPWLKDPRLYKVPLLDVISFGVILLMVGGFVVVGYTFHVGILPGWAAFLLGCVLMNLSFTAWHEPSHGSISRIRWVNHVAGFIASAGSVYPGYFARRREHLVHHRWEGIAGKDPVYYRIQTSFWDFPLQVIRVNFLNEKVPDTTGNFHKITPLQRWSDHFSNGLALALTIYSFYAGFWPALLVVWILPRAVIFVLHAYYICYLPHAIPGGGYRLWRVRDQGSWLRFLTVEQSFHGIHHRWPGIPWYLYRVLFRRARPLLEAEGIEVLTSSLIGAPQGQTPVGSTS